MYDYASERNCKNSLGSPIGNGIQGCPDHKEWSNDRRDESGQTDSYHIAIKHPGYETVGELNCDDPGHVIAKSENLRKANIPQDHAAHEVFIVTTQHKIVET